MTISRPFSRRPSAQLVRRVPANLTGRDLVVGDVHGCFAKLRAALHGVGFNPDAGDRLFSVGDMVNRGPKSDEVLWWLGQPWFFAIRGNHEDMAAQFFRGDVSAVLYAQNGGAWLIGMTPPERLRFADAFEALPVALELPSPHGMIGLVHAECPLPSWPDFVMSLCAPPGDPKATGLVNMALWSRRRIMVGLRDEVAGVRAVLVGHTPVERVTTLGNVHYLDTGAWMSGGRADRSFSIIDAATLEPARAPVPHPNGFA